MARTFQANNKQIIILNEDELEVGKLYFTTLNDYALTLYREIPKMKTIEVKGSQCVVTDEFDGYYDNIYDPFGASEAPLNSKEPFMVLQKEKHHAKFTCVQVVQGDRLAWIVQKYPQLTRKEIDGYISVTDLKNPEEEFQMILKEISKKRLIALRKAELETMYLNNKSAIQDLKTLILQRVNHEKKKKANAHLFQALKEKYIKKV